MILSSDKKENEYTLKINDSHITSEGSVILLGVEIGNKPNLKSIFQLFIKKQVSKST